ncbi:hypothetical protein BDZ89DRAFT_1063971, partial [Hymenopellis radicata]
TLTSPTADDGSPAHTHDVSAVTADALPPCRLYLAGLRLQIEREYPASEYVVTTPASWDVYLELVQSIDELRSNGTLRSLRCSYLSGFILLGHRGLIDIITSTVYRDMDRLQGVDLIGFFCPLGSSRYQDMGQQHSLDGDSALALEDTDENGPTLVIECGGTQSYSSLHRKGMSWFHFPNVKVVILVNLQKKAVTVEIFQRLAAAAIPNAVNTAAQLTTNAVTAQEVRTAQYRTDEAAAGVEIFMSLAISPSNVHQSAADIHIPYSGLFGNNIPPWAPPGTYWTVQASAVERWAVRLMKFME